MTRRVRMIITHVLTFAAAYGVTKSVMPPAASRMAATPQLKTKSSDRAPRMSGRDAARLMTTFSEEHTDPLIKYEKLKETLPVAENLEAAALKSITGYVERLDQCERTGNFMTEFEARDLLVEFEVRVLDWMLRDPDKAVDFLLTNPISRRIGQVDLLQQRVFKDVLWERGVIASLSWLTKNEELLGVLATGAADEMKAGGGVAFLAALQAAMKHYPFNDEYGTVTPEGSDFSEDPYYEGVEFLQTAGGSIPFGDKEKLLDLVARQPDNKSKQLLLSGFARSDGRAAEWMLDLLARGVFKGDLARELTRDLGSAVAGAPDMRMDARLVASRGSPSYDSKSRQAIVDVLVAGDVKAMLTHDRDWCYEFKNDMASIDDVLGAVKEELPNIPPEGELAMRKALFYQLSEGNPAKALPLLDTMPADARREIIFSAAWESHEDDRPEYFLKFLQQMPEPVTFGEKYNRTRGWDLRTRGYLGQYGNEYLEWVKQMPPGFDRDTAINSVISSTRDPMKAREFRDQLTKKRP